MNPIAILYQVNPAPERNGIQKPMKPGGYSDSGADIAFALKKLGYKVCTPNPNPYERNDYDWVFPDSQEGIQNAYDLGARIFWLNTVIYRGHSIMRFLTHNIEIIGQHPAMVDEYDDKWHTNQLLKTHNLPIPKVQEVKASEVSNLKLNLDFPVVTKPLLGRGSQGVFMVSTENELGTVLNRLFEDRIYGDSIYLESYLPGQEITLSIMPPGVFKIENKEIVKNKHWSLPVVKRFNHHNGIAPYNGVVAVIDNSLVLNDTEQNSEHIQEIIKNCEQAASILNPKACIRIDCRANEEGNYFIFDVNLKPNMTGSGRLNRDDQDSLTALAARKLGWTYPELLSNFITQRWKLD